MIMKTPSFTTQVRTAIGGREISRKLSGDRSVVIRQGYFYRPGDLEAWAEAMRNRLNASGLKYTEVSFGDIWKPFRGSARTANSSHFYFEIKE
jgi:hypothetical protein